MEQLRKLLGEISVKLNYNEVTVSITLRKTQYKQTITFIGIRWTSFKVN